MAELGFLRWRCPGSVYPSVSGMGSPRSSKARCWVGVGVVSRSKVCSPKMMVLRARVAR